MWCCGKNNEVGPILRTTFVQILGYAVQHASHDTARDGSIVMATDSNQELQVLWSNGAIVNSTELTNVRPGIYAATVVSADGKPVHCVHVTGPARVGVRTVSS